MLALRPSAALSYLDSTVRIDPMRWVRMHSICTLALLALIVEPVSLNWNPEVFLLIALMDLAPIVTAWELKPLSILF